MEQQTQKPKLLLFLIFLLFLSLVCNMVLTALWLFQLTSTGTIQQENQQKIEQLDNTIRDLNKQLGNPVEISGNDSEFKFSNPDINFTTLKSGCETVADTLTHYSEAAGFYGVIIPPSPKPEFQEALQLIKSGEFTVSADGLPGKLQTSCSGAIFNISAKLEVTKPAYFDDMRSFLIVGGHQGVASNLQQTNILTLNVWR